MYPVYKKKSLGQHFLRSQSALRAIVDAIDPNGLDLIVEIGPGEGVLTEQLIPHAGKVIAIEKDARLIPILKEKFAKELAAGKLDIVEQDALEFDPTLLCAYGLKKFEYKVVGNVPYYITGALFKKFLSDKVQPSTLVFLVQKEVAERIARSKKESILSLSVKAYGEPTYVKTVPKGAFAPPPKVDSAILRVAGVSRKNFASAAHEARFFELVKKGFSSKRKKLSSNLGDIGPWGGERAEDLSLAQWLELAK